MSTSYHICQSVRGALTNWTARDWKKNARFITHDDGKPYTADTLKQAFLDELAKGHEVIPCGDCDNFDYKHGCQGHPCGDPVLATPPKPMQESRGSYIPPPNQVLPPKP